MKNIKKMILVTAVVILGGVSLTSCKKDYTCNCTKTYTTGSGSTTQNYSVYTYKDTRTRAEDRCNANSSSGTDFGGNYSVNCAIK